MKTKSKLLASGLLVFAMFFISFSLWAYSWVTLVACFSVSFVLTYFAIEHITEDKKK